MAQEVLTDAEEKTVLMYFQVPQVGCEPFSTVSRYPQADGERLPSELRMSSKFDKITRLVPSERLANTYHSLTTNDLNVGCATNHKRVSAICNGYCHEWIQAVFKDPIIVTRMKVGPFGKYVKDLKNAFIEIFDESKQKWSMIQSNMNPKRLEILTFSYNGLVSTKQIRIRNTCPGQCLWVGLWKIYGFQN